MAFLDNSGDIILDCVLTTEGRRRLARGDGSFKVAKFALGDDEIDYGLYNSAHPSGSAYYDLSIMQTPVMEAFTDGDAMLKSRLVSIPRTNLLYLPVLKLDKVSGGGVYPSTADVVYVTADSISEDPSTGINDTSLKDNLLRGFNVKNNAKYLRIDQGLDTTAIPPASTLDSDLLESQYIVEIDNRFGSIVSTSDKSNVKAAPSYIDENNIASYYFSLGNDTDFVAVNGDTTVNAKQPIAGPRGTTFKFLIQSSVELQQSSFLFQQLGSTGQAPILSGGNVDFWFLDTMVRITGAQTGGSIDIPVRFLKKKV